MAEQNTTVYVPTGTPDQAKELANKRLVLEWWREFWDKGNDQDWARWMAPDFLNHDPREPLVGAQALVDWLHQSRGPRADTAAHVQPQMFAIGEGDLVFIAHAPMGFDVTHPKNDPGLSVAGNFVRVKDGKIAEWWFTGGGSDVPKLASDVKQEGADKIDITKNSTRPKVYDGTTVIYDSGHTGTAQEAANKRLVLAWLQDFWSNQNQDNWAQYMAPDFRNHDPSEPAVGAQALVNWLRARAAEHPDRIPPKGRSNPHLFIIADGDLVLIAGSQEIKSGQYDPRQQLGRINGNIIRVKDGKIAEWWFIGSNAAPAATPAATPAARTE